MFNENDYIIEEVNDDDNNQIHNSHRTSNVSEQYKKIINQLSNENNMLKSILIRDASASVTFIISLIISICLSFYWVKGLDQIHYYDFSNASGMVFVMSVFVYLGCLVGTELLIIIAASIVTAIKRNRNKNN